MKDLSILLSIFIITVLAIVYGVVGCSPFTPPSSVPTPLPTTTIPADALSWTEAKYHMGDITTVCGPVVGSHWDRNSTGEPTIINIGKDPPAPDRFTIVIWIHSRGNFPQAPEEYYLGKTICATGLIYPYQGIAQMTVENPSQIEELD